MEYVRSVEGFHLHRGSRGASPRQTLPPRKSRPGKMPRAKRREMAHLLHAWRTRPDFLAYAVHDLPAAAPLVARRVFGRPLLTWTVRTPAERLVAARFADQMIFEGFRP